MFNRCWVSLCALARSGLKRPLWIWAIFIFSLACIVWGATLSPSYEACVAERNSNATNYESSTANKEALVSVSRNLRVFAQCEGSFLDANSVLITAIFTGALSLSTGLLWSETRKANIAATKSADAAIALHRPWLKLNLSIAGDLEKDGKGARMKFCADIINIGTSPATNLSVWVGMACGDQMVVKARKKIPPLLPGIGNSLFPDDSYHQDVWGSLTPQEIESAKPSMSVTGYNRLETNIFIIASIKYRFSGGEGETTKAYELRGPDGIFLGTVNIAQLPVPQANMSLDKKPYLDTAT